MVTATLRNWIAALTPAIPGGLAPLKKVLLLEGRTAEDDWQAQEAFEAISNENRKLQTVRNTLVESLQTEIDDGAGNKVLGIAPGTPASAEYARKMEEHLAREVTIGFPALTRDELMRIPMRTAYDVGALKLLLTHESKGSPKP